MKKIILLMFLILVFGLIFWPKTKETISEDKELTKKIGQMLIIGFRGTEVDKDSKIIQDINNYNIGGIILFDRDAPSKSFPRNIINPEQTKTLIEDIKKLSSSDIFITIDAEGGLINRLKEKYGFINIPSPEDMGKDSPEKTKENGIIIGKQLKELGFNVNFAPVVDVNINPDNPVIGYLGRSFSEDPEKIVIYASSFIEGLN